MTKSEILGSLRSQMYQKHISQTDMAKDTLFIHRTTLSKKFSEERFDVDELVAMCDRAGLEILVIPKEV